MPWFLTAYPCLNELPDNLKLGSYGTELWAGDLQDAYEVAAKRRLGEMISSDGRPHPDNHPNVAAMIRRGTAWAKVMHAASFMGWIALRANVATVDEILSDGGLLHGIAHAMNRIHTLGQRERLAELAEAIEARIPGWRAGEEA